MITHSDYMCDDPRYKSVVGEDAPEKECDCGLDAKFEVFVDYDTDKKYLCALCYDEEEEKHAVTWASRL